VFIITCKKTETHLGILHHTFCKLVFLFSDLFSNLSFSFFTLSPYHDHHTGAMETVETFLYFPLPADLQFWYVLE